MIEGITGEESVLIEKTLYDLEQKPELFETIILEAKNQSEGETFRKIMWSLYFSGNELDHLLKRVHHIRSLLHGL